MTRSLALTGSTLIAVALVGAGCSTHAKQAPCAGAAPPAAVAPAHAIAVMHPTAGQQAGGTIDFRAVGDRVRVVAQLSGLTRNTSHGFHIHEFGDCSAPDGTSAGGHFNPTGHEHAGPHGGMRHAGDLGNIASDAQGNGRLEVTVEDITLQPGAGGIIGRGVIVHAQPDDLSSQPSGNAGARIGCGVIGVAKP